MLEGILFELTMIIMQRQGTLITNTIVLECPADEILLDINRKYSVEGFRVYVTCGLYIETRCDRAAMRMSGVDQESCRDDW